MFLNSLKKLKNMNGLKLVAIEVSEEAKLKLKKMNEKREERMKKLVEDYKNGKLK